MKPLFATALTLAALCAQAQTETRNYRLAYEHCGGEIRGAVEVKGEPSGAYYRFTLRNGLAEKIEFLRDGKPDFSNRNDALQYVQSIDIRRERDCLSFTKKTEFDTRRHEHDLDRRGFPKNEYVESDGAMLKSEGIETDSLGRVTARTDDGIRRIYTYDENCNLAATEILCSRKFERKGDQTNYVETDTFRVCSAFRYEYGRDHSLLSERRYDENSLLKAVTLYAYDDRMNLTGHAVSHNEEFSDPLIVSQERYSIKYDASDRVVERSVFDESGWPLYTEAVGPLSKSYLTPGGETITGIKYDSAGAIVEVFNNISLRKEYLIMFLPTQVRNVPVVRYVYRGSVDAKRLYEEIYLDEFGAPAENEDCVSRISHTYDERLIISRSDYFGIGGELLRSEPWDGKKTVVIGNVMFTGDKE